MADLGLVVADLVVGLMLGCVFAVIAHGLNVIWGVTKVVNVAHGEFIMLGAYGAYYLNVYLGFNPVLSVPVDAAIGIGVGFLFYFGLLHRELRGKEAITRESEMVTLVATFGLSLVISNAALAIFKGDAVGIRWAPETLDLGPFDVALGGLYVAISSVAIIAISDLFLSRTYLGNAIRAYSQDIGAAQLMGINPARIAAIATAIGFALTMAGGALLTVWLPVGITPLIGATYAPISFVIVVLGGPGKMWGSLLGGLTLGILIDVLPAFGISASIAVAVAFLVLIPVLLFAREGILR
ncbi:MAG: branched-chain amino acid ABC transporter permease [Methanobacteriota archaeon]|nr:MAG: branched-chain amino acid ABC transporter permease [Euryarchaeota archaeon]